MFVDVQVPEVRVVHEFVWLHVDGRLSAAFIAHAPVEVEHPPELWTCGKQHRELAGGQARTTEGNAIEVVMYRVSSRTAINNL